MTQHSHKVMEPDDLASQLAWLVSADVGALRARWLDTFGKAAPPTFREGMLARAIAYRIQADRYGDVRLGQAHVRSKGLAAKDPVSGVKLIRSWKGEVHEVTCMGERFQYRGQSWRSLSAIAREITGTRWNGLTFFGAKDRSDLSRSVHRV